MKRITCVSFLLLFSIAVLHAANSKSITLNIQGSGPANTVESFKYALTIEANAAGYQINENLIMSNYSIKFTVEFDQIEQKSKFIVSLVKVADSSVIVTMEYFFADEEEMLLYSQLVFFMLMANLPENETTAPENDDWRNKWLYVRASVDYSISFYNFEEEGLFKGAGIYRGNDINNVTMYSLIDNKIISVPGISLGVEVQFLDWMSAEPGVRLSLEELAMNRLIYNLSFSLELKFPLKFFRNLILEPYGGASYTMRFPEEHELFLFKKVPDFSFGGGIQAAVKAGENGAAFIDVNFMYSGDVIMNNQDKLYTKPEVIHYNHFVLGFKIGYKYGFFDRKR
jgi:hypothetical protein